MTEPRELAMGTLTAVTDITDVVDDRLYQFGSIADVAVRPFLVLKFMTAAEVFNWRDGPSEQLMQVWAHDNPGDYLRIDTLLRLVKDAFHAVPSSETLFEIRYQSTSQDLEDDQLGTIVRYSTFQWTLT